MQAPADLPPALSAGAFARLLDQLGAAVGRGNVMTDDALTGHHDPYSFSDIGSFLPSAVLLPASVGEVQAVSRSPTRTASRCGPSPAGATSAMAVLRRGFPAP